MALAEAQALIDRIYQVPDAVEQVPVNSAHGRVLAGHLAALTDLPPFDRAAVDGFAVRRTDLSRTGPTRLRVVGHAAAGHPMAGSLRSGEAVRILTGAPIVDGADLVVMQEHCIRTDQTVVIPAQQTSRSNIRLRGEDCRAGGIALAAGTRLSPGNVALAGALGYRDVPVFPRPRVALFSTGDELCGADAERRDGQIPDANRPLLSGMLASYGCDVVDCGILADRADTVIEALIEAAASHDLIVTSGGVSIGDEDHIAQVIRRRGFLESWRLRIKPGKPVGMGDIDDCPILALPGNPVAAAVALTLLGRHIVGRLSGMAEPWPKPVRLAAGFDVRKKRDYVECWPCRFRHGDGGGAVVELMPNLGAAMLSSLSGAEGLAILDEGRDAIRPGDLIDFLPLT